MLITRYQKTIHAPKEPIPVSIVLPADPQHIYETSKLTEEGDKKHDDEIFHSVLLTVPQGYRKFIPHLIKSEKSNYKWNEKGELVIQNKPVLESNVTDLFSFLMRNRKRDKPSLGFESFFTEIKRLNIPKEWIDNRQLKDDIDYERLSRS